MLLRGAGQQAPGQAWPYTLSGLVMWPKPDPERCYSGNARDSSGNSRHATLEDMAHPIGHWVTDRPTVFSTGESMVFDGTDDEVDVGGTHFQYERTQARSFAGFVRRDNNTSYQTMMGNFQTSSDYRGWGSIWFPTTNTGAIQYYNINNFPSTKNLLQVRTGSLSDIGWHHVAITDDGSSDPDGVNIYYDGADQTLITVEDSLSATAVSNQSMRLGNRPGNENRLDGKAKNYAIWSKVLTQDNVTYLANGGVPGESTDVTGTDPGAAQGDWRFDDRAPTNTDPLFGISDRSTSENLFNQATSANRPQWISASSNYRPGIRGDAANDLLIFASSLSATAGEIAIAFRTDASVAGGTILSSSEGGVTADTLQINIDPTTKRIRYKAKISTTDHELEGATALSADTPYVLIIAHDGSAVTARLNGAAEALTSSAGSDPRPFFGDLIDVDNVVLGGLKQSSETSYADVDINDIQVTSSLNTARYPAWEAYLASNGASLA